jgi:hypothetical protein
MTESQLSAARFAERIGALRVPAGRTRPRMGDVFALAKQPDRHIVW